jgi:hypothetical protein
MRKIERISISAADRDRLERLVRDRNTPQKVVWRRADGGGDCAHGPLLAPPLCGEGGWTEKIKQVVHMTLQWNAWTTTMPTPSPSSGPSLRAKPSKRAPVRNKR